MFKNINDVEVAPIKFIYTVPKIQNKPILSLILKVLRDISFNLNRRLYVYVDLNETQPSVDLMGRVLTLCARL